MFGENSAAMRVDVRLARGDERAIHQPQALDAVGLALGLDALRASAIPSSSCATIELAAAACGTPWRGAELVEQPRALARSAAP